MGRRNPNGYGCVTKLKGNRSRPWLAKVTIYDEQGHAKQTPIGYAETEEKANILLAEYNNNPWKDHHTNRFLLTPLLSNVYETPREVKEQMVLYLGIREVR